MRASFSTGAAADVASSSDRAASRNESAQEIVEAAVSSTVVLRMDPNRLAKSVTFEENYRNGFRRIVRMEEAARVLLERWPIGDTKAYRRAREVAVAVIIDEQYPEDAREAFLDTAADANLNVRNA